jgi:hypothetical protein
MDNYVEITMTIHFSLFDMESEAINRVNLKDALINGGPYECQWYALNKRLADDPSLPPSQSTKDKIDTIMEDTYREARGFISEEGIKGDEVFRTALCGVSDHDLYKGVVRKWFLNSDYIEDDCSCCRSW